MEGKCTVQCLSDNVTLLGIATSVIKTDCLIHRWLSSMYEGQFGDSKNCHIKYLYYPVQCHII